MAGGRPLKFKTLEELQSKIDVYFSDMDKPRIIGDNVYLEPLTITGLALALDTSRETLLDYQDRPEFSDAIKRAKLRVENYAEKMLYLGKAAAGPIFALKNFNWTDKTQQEMTGANGKDLFPSVVAVNVVKPKDADDLTAER